MAIRARGSPSQSAGRLLLRTPTIALLVAALLAALPPASVAMAVGMSPAAPVVVLLGTTAGIFGALWYLRALVRTVASLRGEQSALGAATSAVAHDLRSPLVTVRSYLELLADEAFGPLPAEARRAAERATHATARAQSLVESTLREHTTRSASRPAGAAPQPVELNVVLDEVVASLEAELAAAGARVEVAALPPVAGDGDALYRVFANLLQNALKYARPGAAPRVAISAAPAASGQCEIAVRDWGVGVDPAERERIFERAVRGAAAPDRPGEGYGLATVRELVARQGGRVWVDPDITDGTCIRLSLPAGWRP